MKLLLEMQQINRAIAEALTAQSFDEGLVWEVAPTCPHGHTSTDVDTGDFGEPVWKEDQGWSAGSLCLTCIVDSNHMKRSADADVDFFRARNIRETWNNDVSFAPELRVQKKPHDFTDPRYLFPALEALRYDVEWCPFENETERGWNVEISNATTILGVASEPTLAVALRNAFAAALGVNI